MIKLDDYASLPPEGFTKNKTKKETDMLARQIADKQHLIYAENEKAVLIVLQGMDASGKDGTTRKVFRYCSPIGISAHPFKKPTELEFEHDFLWRVHKLVPEKGKITIFNRSHYEDVLIQRVYNWIDEDTVDKRIDAINNFERLLIHDNNTVIIKLYMHISKERQQQKLQERIDLPRKNWKHNDNDWKERKQWDKYMFCYEEVFNRCNVVPWTIIPCDKRWYRDYVVASTVLAKLNEYEYKLPTIEKKEG